MFCSYIILYDLYCINRAGIFSPIFKEDPKKLSKPKLTPDTPAFSQHRRNLSTWPADLPISATAALVRHIEYRC